MKNKLLISAVIPALSVLLFTASQAAIQKTKLEKCPGINSIIAQGIGKIEPYVEELWNVRNTSYYDTDLEWDLYFIVYANTYEEALNKAKSSLSKLISVAGPFGGGDDTSLYCEYKISDSDLPVITSLHEAGNAIYPKKIIIKK